MRRALYAARHPVNVKDTSARANRGPPPEKLPVFHRERLSGDTSCCSRNDGARARIYVCTSVQSQELFHLSTVHVVSPGYTFVPRSPRQRYTAAAPRACPRPIHFVRGLVRCASCSPYPPIPAAHRPSRSNCTRTHLLTRLLSGRNYFL